MDVKKQLIQAMNCLIEKYPIEKITVEMILKESSISRATFYRYFSDKYKLMNAYYVQHLEQMMLENNSRTQQNTEKYLLFIQNNKTYFTKLLKYKGEDAFFPTLHKLIFDSIESRIYAVKNEKLAVAEIYATCFYSAGTSYCIEKWIEEGMLLSPHSLSMTISENVPAAIADYFE